VVVPLEIVDAIESTDYRRDGRRLDRGGFGDGAGERALSELEQSVDIGGSRGLDRGSLGHLAEKGPLRDLRVLRRVENRCALNVVDGTVEPFSRLHSVPPLG